MFFWGWTFVMLSGSDFPPPSGFYKIVLLIVVLDLIQSVYLLYFLPQLREGKKGLAVRTLSFFAFGEVILSSFFLFFNTGITLAQGLPWLILITKITFLYGVAFWFLNRLLVRKRKG